MALLTAVVIGLLVLVAGLAYFRYNLSLSLQPTQHEAYATRADFRAKSPPPRSMKGVDIEVPKIQNLGRVAILTVLQRFDVSCDF